MRRFLLGVLVASVVWAGVLFAQAKGLIDVLPGDEDARQAIADAGLVEAAQADETEGDARRKQRKKRRPGKRKKSGGAAYGSGDGVTGDAIGDVGDRELAMGEAGGQEQLSAAQIDTVWNGIQRCLVLVPGDLPATGKVVLGMHIGPSGAVTRVGLKGPNPLVQGECGACIRRSVKSIRFPSFDGPEMVAHYPIVFE